MLREHPLVRNIFLTQANAKMAIASPLIDQDVLAEAKRNGRATVWISLRQPDNYSPLAGKLSAQAWEDQSVWGKKYIADFKQKLAGKVDNWQSFDLIHSASATLDRETIAAIVKNPDDSIERISLYKSLDAQPLLSSPTSAIGLPRVWNLSPPLKGQGQNIAVIDSGVEKNHPFLKDTSGNTKVIGEYCYGDLCTSNTDASPCVGLSPCEHGTTVAGVAVGGPVASGPYVGMQGVAPSAKLIAIKAASKKDSTSIYYKVGDYYSALQTLAFLAQFNVVLGSNQIRGDNLTINMSLGTPVTGPIDENLRSRTPNFCPTFPGETERFRQIFQTLYSLKVPVVIAAGNDGSYSQVNWPACMANTIKAVNAYENGDFYSRSNSVPDTNGVNSPVFAAPGVNVVTSTVGGGYVTAQAGSSISAPFVAGFYALYKQAVPGATVQQATADMRNWIRNATWTTTRTVRIDPHAINPLLQSIFPNLVPYEIPRLIAP